MTDIIVFDLETTGPDAFTARIVTAYAAVLRADGVITDEVDLLVAPDGYEIPDGATAVHGVTTEHAAQNGVPLAAALSRLRSLFERHPMLPIAGHNLAYDLTILDEEDKRVAASSAHPWPPTGALSHPILDSLVLDRALDKYRRGGRKLTQVAAHYGVPLDNAHNANGDAVAAGMIVQRLLTDKRIAHLSPLELHSHQETWKAEQCASLQAFLRRTDPTVVVDPGWPLLIGAVA